MKKCGLYVEEKHSRNLNNVVFLSIRISKSQETDFDESYMNTEKTSKSLLILKERQAEQSFSLNHQGHVSCEANSKRFHLKIMFVLLNGTGPQISAPTQFDDQNWTWVIYIHLYFPLKNLQTYFSATVVCLEWKWLLDWFDIHFNS